VRLAASFRPHSTCPTKGTPAEGSASAKAHQPEKRRPDAAARAVSDDPREPMNAMPIASSGR
jgi:hypothetical protein